MMKHDDIKNKARIISKAQRHLMRARQLVAEGRASTRAWPRTEAEVIAKLRATREQLWEEKLASRP